MVNLAFHGLYGLRAAQRFALAAPPNGHYGSATAYKRKYVRNTAVGGVGYRRMLGRGMADDGRSAHPTLTTGLWHWILVTDIPETLARWAAQN